MTHLRRRTPYVLPLVWFVVVGLTLAPFHGRWAALKDLLPIVVVALFYWTHRYNLDGAGLGRPAMGWKRCIGYGLALAMALYAFGIVTTKPLARWLFDQPKDLTLFEPMKGDLKILVVYLIFMWLLAAFGEEFIWRGFLLRQLGEAGRGFSMPWVLGVVVTSLLFGLVHTYQGHRGVFETTISSLILGTIYVATGRSSIWLVVLVHGFKNTISFVAIYFDAYYAINFLSL